MADKEYQLFVREQKLRAWWRDNWLGMLLSATFVVCGGFICLHNDYLFFTRLTPQNLGALDDKIIALVMIVLGLGYPLWGKLKLYGLKRLTIVLMTFIWGLLMSGLLIKYLYEVKTISFPLSVNIMTMLLTEAYRGNYRYERDS